MLEAWRVTLSTHGAPGRVGVHSPPNSAQRVGAESLGAMWLLRSYPGPNLLQGRPLAGRSPHRPIVRWVGVTHTLSRRSAIGMAA